MNEKFNLGEINRRLRKEGLKLLNVPSASWFVLYKLEYVEETDTGTIHGWERLCEIPNNDWRESE